jgi:hypothetical protein
MNATSKLINLYLSNQSLEKTTSKLPRAQKTGTTIVGVVYKVNHSYQPFFMKLLEIWQNFNLTLLFAFLGWYLPWCRY